MAECMTPFTVTKKLTNDKLCVPCGRCPACYARRVSGWSFRLLQEQKQATSSHFITLTYDTQTLPLSPRGFNTLDKRDVQLFLKRLRKLHPRGSRLKYYAVGEYGGVTQRPHYHIILFNCTIELILPAWGLGSIHYGKVEGASIGYCLKYISKKSHIGTCETDDRQPQFALMSKNWVWTI